MAPPNPIQCSVDLCPYATPQGLPTYDLVTEHLRLHVQSAHPPPAGQQPHTGNVVTARVDKQTRPGSKRDMTEHEFAFYSNQWERYKRATGISGQLLIDELWATMSPDLQQFAFDQGAVESLNTEALMMERIRSLAVTIQHKAVHTVQLHSAKQQPHESVKAFAARVRGIASNCGLKKKCSCNPATDVSYLEETVHDVVLAGLREQDLQEKCTAQALLGNISDIQTLVAFCTAEESGRLGTHATISALRKSSYVKEKNRNQTNTSAKCKWCGEKAHSGSSPDIRAKECSAYKQTCSKCQKPHHTAKACRQPPTTAAVQSTEELVTPQTAGFQFKSFGFFGISASEQQKQNNQVVAGADPSGVYGRPATKRFGPPDLYIGSAAVERTEPLTFFKAGGPDETQGPQTTHSPQCRKKGKKGQSRRTPTLTGRENQPEWRGDERTEQSLLAGLGQNQTFRIPLCHMVETSEGWQEANPPANPTVAVNLSVHLPTYSKLGLAPPTSHHPQQPVDDATTESVADSGAQMNIIPASTIVNMKISLGSLLKVRARVHGAVQGSRLNIIGGIFLHVQDPHSPATKARSTQLFYVASNVSNIYLSLACLKALAMVGPDFPSFGEASHVGALSGTSTCKNTGVVINENETCNCPTRSLPPDQPPRLPCAPTDANLHILKQYIVDRYKASAFNTCERQALPLISGSPPLELHVDPEATPVACHTPSPVPLHWQGPVKAGLDRDCRLGVIEKVPPNTPTKWSSRMVCTSKTDGSVRRCVDYGPVNAHCPRQTHHTPSPWHLAASVPENTRRTVIDNWHGYHSLPLATEEDRNLTIFITPWGRYRYLTSPQGLKPSGDGFTDRMDSLFSDFERSRRCVDDTLLYDDSIEAQFFRTCSFLDRAAHHGIILNPAKFQFAEKEVNFVGFRLTASGPRPTDEFLNGIRSFPTPNNITDVRSWFGAINQISYSFATCPVMAPFRHLLASKAPFAWSPELDAAFQASKEEILRQCEQGVRTFDPNRRTCLATDWSKTGLGFWLCQQRCNCSTGVPGCCPNGWQTVYVGSRFCSGAEQRYAPIEGEALAAAWATNKCRYFLLGLHFLLAVDHKPLLPIFSTKALDMIFNPRIRNQRVKLLPFAYTPIHVAGKANVTPDTLSRRTDSPVSPPTPAVDLLDITNVEPGYSSHLGPPSWVSGPTASLATLTMNPPESAKEFEDEEHLISLAIASLTGFQGGVIGNLTRTEAVQAITWPRLQAAAAVSPHYQTLIDLISNGLPSEKSKWPESLHEYYPYRLALLVVDGIAMCGERPIIPASLRPEVLETLHAGHSGVTTMLAKATQSLFWPTLKQDLIDLRAHCRDCTYAAPSNPAEPPQPPVQPDFPFSHICMDFFQVDATYLAMADRYSNWLSVFKLAKDDSHHIIEVLRQYFARWGIAKEVTSDGAAVFTSAAMQDFFARWGVSHRVSSAYYPRANKRAEVAVKAAKRLVMGNLGSKGTLNTDSFARALLEHRNTVDPLTQLSPAMIIFGRELKGFLPAIMSKYQPRKEWRLEADLREQAHAQRHAKMEERLTLGTRVLPPLKVGDTVVVQDQSSAGKPGKWTKTGVIIESLPYHSYMIRIHGSRAPTQRNRRFLRKITPYASLLPTEPCTLPVLGPATRSSSSSPNLGPPPLHAPPTMAAAPPVSAALPPPAAAQSPPAAAQPTPPNYQQPTAADHRLHPVASPGFDTLARLREMEARGHHLALHTLP